MAKWTFLQIEPQKARGTLNEDLWSSKAWVAEEKYDGDRRIAQFCGKVVRFTGRRQSVKDGLYVEKTENIPHLSGSGLSSLSKGRVPLSLEGTVLDGEMMFYPEAEVEGGRSKFVTSIMGSLPEEAIKKQLERGWLEYVVFDCLFYKGTDVRKEPQWRRRELAEAAREEWGNRWVRISEQVLTDKRKFLETIFGWGGEGVILKDRNAPYGQDRSWVKVKKTATADVVIMGYVDAKKLSKKRGQDEATLTKYAKAGLIGALSVGQYVSGVDEACGSMQRSTRLGEVATISGMDDDLRKEFTKNPKKYIGQVVEIEHNGREPTGRFRHPRFNRFRPDKAAVSCVYHEGES